MKLYILFTLLLASLLMGCVPSEDIASSATNPSDLELSATPSFISLKRNDETRITISGGTPPYQVSVTDSALGSAYINPGDTIASVFSKPTYTGNFSVLISDSVGNNTFAVIDVTDGFKLFPRSRQAYPGRKIQITPLEGDLSSYTFTLAQGEDQGSIDANGLLSISHTATNNSLIAIEVENSSTGEKEESFIYVRDVLDSENIVMGLGYMHTCLAKTNVNQSSSNLQCWGKRLHGALGEKDGIVSAEAAPLVETTKIITSLATQYPRNISLSGSVGCATFFNGFYSPNDIPDNNAQSIKCWGNGQGSPDTLSGLHPGTMGTSLPTYTFKGDTNNTLYIQQIESGEDFHCAVLSENLDSSITSGSIADNTSEIRCWGSGSYGNGALITEVHNTAGRLGLNTGVITSLLDAINGETTSRTFNYVLNGVSRVLPSDFATAGEGFPTYVHALNDAFDATTGNISLATYKANITKIKGKSLSLGANHACVIRTNSVPVDSITCWGDNTYQQTAGFGDTSHNYGGNMFHSTGSKNRLSETHNTFTPSIAPKKLFSGRNHSCMIDINGRLHCWGQNTQKQADPNNASTSIRAQGTLAAIPFYAVGGLTEEFVIDGAAGSSHTCVIVNVDPNATKGRVVCYGGNAYGQKGLGIFGGTNGQPSPGEYADLGNILFNNGTSAPYQAVKLVATDHSTCALLEKSGTEQGHSVKCWGRNHINQLGYGDIIDRPTASDAEGFTIGDGQVLDISSSLNYGVCALKLNGDLKCWGNAASGALGQENFQVGHENPAEPLQGLQHTDLKTFASEIKDLSAAYYSNCALFKSGHTHCWGYNHNNGLGVGHSNYLGNEPNELDGIQTYASGNVVQILQVALTQHSGCAIDSDYKVRCWGHPGTGVPAQESSAVVNTRIEDTPPLLAFSSKKALKLAAGTYHMCGLFENSLKNHEVHCWGYNGNGELGKTTNSAYVGRYTDSYHNIAPTPFTTHISSPVNLNLGAGDTVLDIKSGQFHSCVLVEKAGTKEENYVKCWGKAETIGVGTLNDPVVPDISGLRYKGSNFVSPKLNFGGDNPVGLVVGYNHSCVLFDTEQVKCWGENNSYGKLGWAASGDYIEQPAPKGSGYVDLGDGRRATRIFSGKQALHTCAVLESDDDLDGRYDTRCWGRNTYGQLGVGSVFSTNENTGYQFLKETDSLLRYRID